MKKICKRWIGTPVIAVIFTSLSAFGNFAAAANPCDIAISQPDYTIGQTVQLSVFRLTNATAQPIVYEWKLWLRLPGTTVMSLVNLGADSSLVLPGLFDVDFASLVGPIDIFEADNVLFGTGTYEIGCRLVDPITGEEFVDADVISFDVN